MSPDVVDHIHRTGPPPGYKPIHLVIGAVVFIVWFGVLGFVLTHGRGEGSSVDVYSELPTGFTAALSQKGITYEGLSPVDAGTQQQALAHAPADPNANGGKPLVFRTSYAATKGAGQPRTPTPVLMVVTVDTADNGVHVEFLDLTTYRELDSLDYTSTG